MSLPTPELKLGYELFSKLLTWAAGKRSSKRLEALKSKAFQELLKGDAADLDLVASVLKEIHKVADTSARAVRLEHLYERAAAPQDQGQTQDRAQGRARKPERRKRSPKAGSGTKG